MAIYSLSVIIVAVITVTVVVLLGTISNRFLMKFTIEQRVKIDNGLLTIFGLLSLIFIVGILASFHLFDPTYFKNDYDYQYQYQTIDGDKINGEFDVYKNIAKLQVGSSNLMVMAFLENDNTGLPNSVYYQVKTESNMDHDFEIICNNTNYIRYYSTSSIRFIVNNEQLQLLCSPGDIVTIRLTQDDQSEEVTFEYDLSQAGFHDLPTPISINDLHPVLLLFVFVIFFYLIFKKIQYHRVNAHVSTEPKPYVYKIVLASLTVVVMTLMTILSFNDDGMTFSSSIEERYIFLEETYESESGSIIVRYDYLHDILYFKTEDLNHSLDLEFDSTHYVFLRTIDFATLEDIQDDWYVIENINQYETLTIRIYESETDDTILYEENVSLVHPYYE